jgi:spermidine/putrescine transport system permease protein
MAHRLTHWMRQHNAALLAMPSIAWLMIFFIVPVIVVFVISLMTRATGGHPELPLTFEHYQRSLTTFRPIIYRSLWISFLTTLFCILLGYPIAYYIFNQRRAWLRQVLLFAVVLPFWTNFLVRTYAWRVLLGREGLINGFLLQLNLINEPLALLNTEFAVLLGLVYGFLPFMVLPIYVAMERLDTRLIEAADDLGAPKWRSFIEIWLPLTMPGLIAGSILVFIPAIGSYVTPDLLGGRQGLMIGNLIQSQFQSTGNMPLGAALSSILMLLVAVPTLIYAYMSRREG